jgi:nucleoside 2-deoxyribosyltransferase
MISRTVVDILRPRPPNFGLSAWVRSQEGASELPWLLSSELEQIEKNLPRYTVPEKQLLLLRAIESRSRFAGAKVHIATPYDFTLAWLSSEEELQYIMRALMGRDLLALEKYSDPKDSFSHEVTITPRGWDYLDERAKPAQFSNQAFVAMAFADELRPAWSDGLAPGLKAAGFNPYRVDVELHLDRIDAKIITEIKNSKFLVADVTLQRPGVYFEAGFAIGLGLPVFWCVREDELAKVHFDTRQYNHIVWRTAEHLRDQLTPFVTAIIGRGTAA